MQLDDHSAASIGNFVSTNVTSHGGVVIMENIELNLHFLVGSKRRTITLRPAAASACHILHPPVEKPES